MIKWNNSCTVNLEQLAKFQQGPDGAGKMGQAIFPVMWVFAIFVTW